MDGSWGYGREDWNQTSIEHCKTHGGDGGGPGSRNLLKLFHRSRASLFPADARDAAIPLDASERLERADGRGQNPMFFPRGNLSQGRGTVPVRGSRGPPSASRGCRAGSNRGFWNPELVRRPALSAGAGEKNNKARGASSAPLPRPA